MVFTFLTIVAHWSRFTSKFYGEGKRWNEFVEWHVAWLAEWHNYAECKKWRKEIN